MRFIEEGHNRILHGSPLMKGTTITVPQVLEEIAGDSEALKGVAETLGVPIYDIQGVVYELSLLIRENGLPKELYATKD